MSSYLAETARISSLILNFLGENCQLTGATIWSPNHAVTVLSTCSAIEFAGFFCAAVISFPASFVRKAGGILAGVPLLLALNLTRIMSLYYVDVHFRESFDAIHEQVWPTTLVVSTLLICTGWLRWAMIEDPIATDVTAQFS